LTPERRAAIVFSFTPPMARIRPVSVISPVIAKSFNTSFSRARERRDVTIVQPAEGPSFGVAPSGTCMWKDDWNIVSVRVERSEEQLGTPTLSGGEMKTKHLLFRRTSCLVRSYPLGNPLQR
jgi:hypothetical protein